MVWMKLGVMTHQLPMFMGYQFISKLQFRIVFYALSEPRLFELSI